MKRLLSLLAIGALLLASCGKKDIITVKTTSAQAEGKTIYLLDYFAREVKDSAVFADGIATFNDKSDSAYVALLVMQGAPAGFLITEHGEITCDIDSNTVQGTKLNERLSAFSNEIGDLQQQIAQEYQAAVMNDEKANAESIMQSYNRQFSDIGWKYYRDNDGSLMGAFVVTLMAEDAKEGIITLEQIDSLLEVASPIVREYKPLLDCRQRMLTLRATQEGAHFADFGGIDFATGAQTTLAKMIAGQVAVVDFWASWCAPCHQEITNTLLPLYDKYKDKGLVVVGVDISDQPEAHRNAVQKLGITYPQLIDNSPDGTPATIYGVTQIPYIMVIDANGTIVSKGLRGEEIEQVVRRLL